MKYIISRKLKRLLGEQSWSLFFYKKVKVDDYETWGKNEEI